jgi:hypothetical protein
MLRMEDIFFIRIDAYIMYWAGSVNKSLPPGSAASPGRHLNNNSPHFTGKWSSDINRKAVS